MTIVIADDSEQLLLRIREALKDIKEVEIIGEAKNGIKAIKIIQEKNPEFILLDIQMPKLNGIEVLTKIKENGSNAVVCIFTNYPYAQFRNKCKEKGADYFFDKSKGFQEVKNLIVRLSKKKK